MVRRLDQVLANDPFAIDESACYLASQEVRRYASKQNAISGGEQEAKSTALFKLFFVSICHQINWDFLLGRLQMSFYSTDPQRMLSCALTYGAADVEKLLEGYSRPERIRAKERAKILRDVASVIERAYGGDLDRLFFPRSIGGRDGLIERLDKFPAYAEDPVRKKINVYVQELLREGVASFEDESTVQPAVDYHLIRLYLRTGRVTAKEEIIKNLLTSSSPTRMRVITLLRLKVSEALSLTAFYASKSVFELNYIEWQIARQRCEYGNPICTGEWPDRSFDSAVIAIQPDRCPFSAWCPAHNDTEWSRLREPEVRKAFY